MYGGTYAEYMNTPERVIEQLLAIDDAYTPQPAAPLQDPEPYIG